MTNYFIKMNAHGIGRDFSDCVAVEYVLLNMLVRVTCWMTLKSVTFSKPLVDCIIYVMTVTYFYDIRKCIFLSRNSILNLYE